MPVTKGDRVFFEGERDVTTMFVPVRQMRDLGRHFAPCGAACRFFFGFKAVGSERTDGMKTIDSLIDFCDRLATPRVTDTQIEIIEKKP
jgi:hypothetical protein